MKNYKLIVNGITGERDNIVRGFAAAEERAKELLREYIENYPDCNVECVEEDEAFYMHPHLVYQRDIFGDEYWMWLNPWNPMPYLELLTDEQKDWLEELCEEMELHVADLNHQELMQLRKEVYVGSLCYSDYQNSFEIDTHEVCDICDCYLENITTDDDGNELPEEVWEPLDTPKNFAEWCYNNL